jgi:hypothetical protein
VAKDKKKKKNGKKAKAAAASPLKRTKAVAASPLKKGSAAAGKVAKGLRSLNKNPLVADIVAAALVATAAALKDTKTARRLASEAGDELEKMSKKGAERGQALWDMALDIGRRSLEAFSEENAPKRAKSKPASRPSPEKRQGARKNSR